MKEISALPSGFFNRRVLLAFALCSVGVLLAMLSFAANPPSGMRGSSGSSTGGSLFVENHAVPFKGNTAAMGASMPLNPIGPRWSIVESPNNGSPGTNQFFATTCASASDCWAVGYSDIGNGYSTLIQRWNGSVWKIVSSPNNSGNSILYGVTCTSTSDCWAVGTYWDDGLFQRTLIEHWNNNAWNIVSSPNRGLVRRQSMFWSVWLVYRHRNVGRPAAMTTGMVSGRRLSNDGTACHGQSSIRPTPAALTPLSP